MIEYAHAGISHARLATYARKLKPEITDLRDIIAKQSWSDKRSCVLLPDEREIRSKIKRLVRDFGTQDHVVVCGIGGSSLGTKTIMECLSTPGTRRISFAENLDEVFTRQIMDEFAKDLSKRKKCAVVIVTKSGKTSETAAQGSLFVHMLRQRNHLSKVVVVTDNGSPLWAAGHENNVRTIQIPSNVGGRYSVLSSAGLVPFALVGGNIDPLLRGAASMRAQCMQYGVKNPALVLAAIAYEHLAQGRNVLNLFTFDSGLEMFGKWCQQLFAESLGKTNRAGKKVGMLPIVSRGSTDLHSLLQRYLGGPDDTFTIFLRTDRTNNTARRSSLHVPHEPLCADLVPQVVGRDFADIVSAMYAGVTRAYVREYRPFVELRMHELDEHALGGLFMLVEIMTVFLGRLLGVNAFDQPAVEWYKYETRRLLGKF